MSTILDLSRFTAEALQTHPFAWAELDRLYGPDQAAALAATFPRDGYKTVSGYGGEKDYHYEARALIPMGAAHVSAPERLSPAWRALAQALLSADYRTALGTVTGVDLHGLPMEANAFHYGPGACLGPHPDLPDKQVTHILYFNPHWQRANGGCLTILNSADPDDISAWVEPLVGNSAVLVRSDSSWHAVSPVVQSCTISRRSLTVTFYQPGSVSSLWPPGDHSALHDYGDDSQ